MRFRLDANLPRSSAALLQKLGHEILDVRDVLPKGIDDAAIAAHAQTHQLILITRDFDSADIRNYPPEKFAGLVVLEMPDDATATQINKVLESFAGNKQLLERLPSRLAIVESWRVRFRPA
jgi:predicted nuclease of predicted toxin-antitoxin system